MWQYDVIIIGGGLAGITAARQCLKHDPNQSVAIIEKRALGGQLYSTCHRGTWFDVGGHFFHNIEQLPEDYAKFSLCCQPFEKNTYSVDVNSKIYHGMIQDCFPPSTLAKDSSNLYQYLRTSFGEQVFDLFLLPYNSKLHRIPLSQCTVPKAMKRQTPAKGCKSYNNCFLYPREGGALSFINFLLHDVKDKINFIFDEATSFTPENKTVCLLSGRRLQYKKALFNSSSIIHHLKMDANSPVVYVTNGYACVNKQFSHLEDPCWCYIAEPATSVFRIGNYAICGGGVKDGQIPFYLESYCPVTEKELKRFFTDFTITSEYTVYNAYPLATAEAEKQKELAIAQDAGKQVYWIGRYGKDSWFSMSDTILDTIDVVDQINWGA